jgi:hypothetical protein
VYWVLKKKRTSILEKVGIKLLTQLLLLLPPLTAIQLLPL